MYSVSGKKTPSPYYENNAEYPEYYWKKENEPGRLSFLFCFKTKIKVTF